MGERQKNSMRSNQEASSYVNRLLTWSMDAIATEPSRLASHRVHLEKQMDELALSNFGVFIASASSTEEMGSQISSLADQSIEIADSLPQLSSSSQQLCQRIHSITKARKINHKTLRQHSSLLEILSMPQLMESCIRNQLFEEALHIQHHALRLCNQYGDIPIMRMIAEDIKNAVHIMQAQIHQRLCESITIPACLRLIGFLKRMNVYSDWELRINFLQCRGVFLAETLSTISSSSSTLTSSSSRQPTQPNTLTQIIDTTRSQLSEIITQYKAIFDQDATGDLQPSDIQSDSSTILQSWVFYQVDEFISTLDYQLSLITDCSRIANHLSQSMYFGLAMARFGADFRHLLAPVFEKRIVSIFKSSLYDALDIFASQLKRYKNVLGLNSFSTNPEKADVNGKSQPGTPSAPIPPLILMDYIPLAHLTNGILAAMNELRKCCPYSIATQIASIFEATLESAIEQLHLFKAQMEGDSEAELQSYFALCRVTLDEFLPFIMTAYDALWKSPRRMLSLEKLKIKMVEYAMINMGTGSIPTSSGTKTK